MSQNYVAFYVEFLCKDLWYVCLCYYYYCHYHYHHRRRYRLCNPLSDSDHLLSFFIIYTVVRCISNHELWLPWESCIVVTVVLLPVACIINKAIMGPYNGTILLLLFRR
jgi:hypothetical protein